MDNRPSRRGGVIDRVAIGLSGLCLAHCLLLPFAVILLPILTQFGSGHFHVQMLFVVVPVSLFALGRGYFRHRRVPVLAWGLVGLATMIVGGTVAHANYGNLADTVLTVAGATILAAAHFFNSRLTRHARAAAGGASRI